MLRGRCAALRLGLPILFLLVSLPQLPLIYADSEGDDIDEVDPLGYSVILGGGIDGTVYAIHGETGDELWRFNTGGPLLASAHLQHGDSPQIIPSLDGTLFTYVEGEGLTQLPINARDVAEDSHFRAADGTVFLSSKDTKLYSLDAEKGTINYIRSPSASANGAHSYKTNTYFGNDVLIGRSDYHVRAIDEETGLERWNLTFGEFFVFDSSPVPHPGPDDLRVQSDIEGNVRAFGAHSGELAWTRATGSPLVVLFNLTETTLMEIPTPFAEQLQNMEKRKRFKPGMHNPHQHGGQSQTSIGAAGHAEPTPELQKRVYIGKSKYPNRDQIQLFALSYTEPAAQSDDEIHGSGNQLSHTDVHHTGTSTGLQPYSGSLMAPEDIKHATCAQEWDGEDMSCIIGLHPVEYRFRYDPAYSRHYPLGPGGQGDGQRNNGAIPQLGPSTGGDGNGNSVNVSGYRAYLDVLHEPATHITTLAVVLSVLLWLYKFRAPEGDNSGNKTTSDGDSQVKPGHMRTDSVATTASTATTATTMATTATEMSVDTRLTARGSSDSLVPHHHRAFPSITSPLAPMTPSVSMYMSRYYSDFEELEKLGSGAFGTVFRVRNTLDGREYAMKKVRLPVDDRMRQRVINEVKHLAKMDHKNVVRYHHAWVEPLQPGKTMKEELGLSDSEDDEVTVTVTSWTRNQAYSDDEDSDTYDPSQRRRRRTTNGNESDSSFSAGVRKLSTALQSDPYDDEEFMGRTLADSGWSEEDSSVFEDEDDSSDDSGDAQRKSGAKSGTTLTVTASTNQTTITKTLLDDSRTGTSKSSSDTWRKPRPSEELDGSIAHAEAAAPGGQNIMYIQMLLCTKTLKTWLRREDRVVDKVENMVLFRQIVDGLCYVHELDLVHRDLNPANIFIEEGEASVIRIGDFGLTKDHSVPAEAGGLKARSDMRLGMRGTLEGSIVSATTGAVGTPMYIAPEVKSRSRTGNKVDIYSLGVIFFEFLHPFGTFAERHKVLGDLCTGKIPDYIANTHEQETMFVKWLMDPDPKKRPSAREILDCDLVNAREYDLAYSLGIANRSPALPHLHVQVSETPTVLGDIHSVIKDAELVITHSDTVYDTKNEVAVLTFRFDPIIPRGIQDVVETLASHADVRQCKWVVPSRRGTQLEPSS